MSQRKPKRAAAPAAPPDLQLRTERIEFERIVIGKQIRIFFGDIADLATKIEASSWIDPLVVRLLDNGTYQLICGERRYKAIRLLRKTDRDNGLPLRHDRVDAQIYEGGDLGAMLLNARENLGRKDLTHYELALYVEELAKRHSLTHVQIAAELGLSSGHVSKVASILKLDGAILDNLKKGTQIPLNQMAAWVRLRPEQQVKEYRQWLGLEEQSNKESKGRKTKRKMLPYRKAEGLLSALEQAKADRMTLAAVRYLMGLRDKPPVQLVAEPQAAPAREIPPSDPMGD